MRLILKMDCRLGQMITVTELDEEVDMVEDMLFRVVGPNTVQTFGYLQPNTTLSI